MVGTEPRTRVGGFHAALAVALIAAVLVLTPTAAQGAGPSVFINEIHYDNASTDVGEAFEIAGPAGTNLTGWSVVLYNGNGGASYNTIALSGTIADQQGGFGTVSPTPLPSNGIQNGSPDGLALVNAGGAVVEFLSYEGAFVAVGGPANGMLSTDIGVSEPGTTPIGNSLQLLGTGTMGGDFTWATTQPSTFGAVNTGQTFGVVTGPTDPVINEFVANHTGADSGAFVEVFGDASTDYSAFTVLEIEGDSSGAGVIDAVLAVGTTNGGGYWIDDEDMENGTITILLVENFSGSKGADLDTDNDGTFDSTPWARIVDDVATTDGGGSDVTYSSSVLGPFFDGNPFGAGGASRIPNGTDTDTTIDWTRNDFDGFGLPGFPGRTARHGGTALRTDHQHRLRGLRARHTGVLQLRCREGRPARPHPLLGDGTGAVANHGEPRVAGLDSHGAARRRSPGGEGRIRGRSAHGAYGRARGCRTCCGVPRFGRREVHHRPAPLGQWRQHSRMTVQCNWRTR